VIRQPTNRYQFVEDVSHSMPAPTTLTPAIAPATTAGSRLSRSGLAILFAASGASGLMLEVIWSRMLGWLLGATTWSVMTVLIAFMGGLGLGGILWGRLAGRSARPLRLFGLMELSIGLYSLAVPFLFSGLGRFFIAMAHSLGESPRVLIALRVLTAVLALAPPTLLMGGTLPVLARFAAAGQKRPGETVGWLYAANTAGAVLGCFVSGCLLIIWLGVIETGVVAAGIDLIVGLTALYWDLHQHRAVPAEAGAAAAQAASGAAALGGLAAIWIASVSGFCGLAYELLWTRGLLAAMTDDTTYAFALMLTAFLAGHALGAAIESRRRSVSSRDRDWRRLGQAQILAASTALCSLPLLAAIQLPINRLSFSEGLGFWSGRVPLHLAVSLFVFAPAAAFLGASFAIAARLYVGYGRNTEGSTGRLYGFNTLSAVVGAAATTAWLIPALGAQRSLIVLALGQAALGALLLVRRGSGRTRWPARVGILAAWALLVASACGLNHVFPLSGVYARQEPGKLLALVEGSGATLTVHQRTATDRVISINGVNVAGTNPVLRATQKLQAHLPVCLHPSPVSVLQIGFGSGGTCYSVSLHREVKSIEVAELNPDVLTVASQWFADVNHGVLDDPRVRVRIVDAKSHVAVTDQTYDLILSDSTHPRFRGNAALYARDYFENCARRLRPGGILSTWLPLYGMSVQDVRGILKSIQSVFPHVQVWYANPEPHENTIVIASRQPIVINTSNLASRLADAQVAGDLAEVSIISMTQLLDFFLLGDRAVSEFARTGELNTDDHPRLEFFAPRSLGRRQSWTDNFAALRLAREPIEAYLAGADSATRSRLARWYRGTTFKLAGQSAELEGRAKEALKAYTEGVRLNPEDVLAQVRLARFRQALAPPAQAGLGGPTGP
jgi:spermidine synthase